MNIFSKAKKDGTAGGPQTHRRSSSLTSALSDQSSRSKAGSVHSHSSSNSSTSGKQALPKPSKLHSTYYKNTPLPSKSTPKPSVATKAPPKAPPKTATPKPAYKTAVKTAPLPTLAPLPKRQQSIGSFQPRSHGNYHSVLTPPPQLRHSKSLSHMLHKQQPQIKRYPSKYKEDLLKHDCTCKGCSSYKHTHKPYQHANTSEANSIDSVDNFANNILDIVTNKCEVKWNI